ncbi:hypothetical protein FNF28_06772 [Cafeteria roenbergensis]|uniref:GAF domain-containing protein n=1 Tax=Cafeteria roenbergensis TaxID=33653 RepID=A0A5A8CQQ8_CAFRO|nr:hypothetical protein FNF28_06772 [Cafeteria roenbergensis]
MAAPAFVLDVSAASGASCGQRAVTRLADIEAASDEHRKLLCYSAAVASLRKFFGKYPDMGEVARMATVNSVLKSAFPHMWFVGFYTVEPSSSGGQELVIGAYQGDVLACGRIAHGRGVCGTAWAKGATQNVPDVSAIDNYVACDAETQSEIVVPVFGGAEDSRRVTSVLDIDSEHKAAFSAVDERCLEAIVAEFIAEPATVPVAELGTPGALAWAEAQGLLA